MKKGNIVKGCMHIKVFCILTAGLLLLSACQKAGGEYENRDETLDGSDMEYCYIAESENGYYYWERMNDDQYYPRLMFMDRESGRVVPLCNKPDCSHEGVECNSYFNELDSGGDGIDKHYLQYYEGSLYAVGISSDNYATLFRISEDGSEWEISTKLYRTDYAATGHWITPDILINEGYVYYVDRKQKKMKLERVKIGGGTTEVAFEGSGDAVEVQVYRVKSADGDVFFQALSFVNESVERAEGGLYQYNETIGKSNLVREDLIGPYSVWNGRVYYGGISGLCCYSMQDQNEKILVDQPMDVPHITLTEENIIIYDQTGGGILYGYSYEGAEIFTVTDGLKPTWYFGGNSDLLFGERADEEGLRMCFLDLNRPVAQLQWEELKEN